MNYNKEGYRVEMKKKIEFYNMWHILQEILLTLSNDSLVSIIL